MKVRLVPPEANGTRSVEIRCSEICFDALIRCIRRIPGASVSMAHENPLTDDASAIVRYKDVDLKLWTPFSDFFIDCAAPGPVFDDFVSYLTNHKVRWWEKFF